MRRDANSGIVSRQKELADQGLTVSTSGWFWPTHADLIVNECRSELRRDGLVSDGGWIDLEADALADRLYAVAARFGATWITTEDLMRDAEANVAFVLQMIDALNQSGGLKELNRSYKAYRQKSITAGRGAARYHVYLANFTTEIVRLAAINARPESNAGMPCAPSIAPIADQPETLFDGHMLAQFLSRHRPESVFDFSKRDR